MYRRVHGPNPDIVVILCVFTVVAITLASEDKLSIIGPRLVVFLLMIPFVIKRLFRR
jgi:hypothetical protein